MPLPTTIDPASPAGTDPAAQGDDQIRALKQFLVDVFGLPASPNQIAVAVFTVAANGVRGPEIQSTYNPTTNADSHGLRIQPTINKAGSGTHNLFSSVRVDPPTIGESGATLTESVTVYISGAPSVGNALYALRVAAGNARLDGRLLMGTSVETSASPGEVVLPNNKFLRGVKADGSDTVPLIGLDTNNNVFINLGVITLGLYTAIESGGIPVR